MIYEVTKDEDAFYDAIMEARQKAEDECDSQYRRFSDLELMYCDYHGEWDDSRDGDKEWLGDPEFWSQQDWDEVIGRFRRNATALGNDHKYICACVRFDDIDEDIVRDLCAQERIPTHEWLKIEGQIDVFDYQAVYGDCDTVLEL